MPDLKRVELISARKLPDMVEKAVELAIERTSIKPSKFSVITKWELIGRRLKDMGEAKIFADEVALNMGKSGVEVNPAVLAVDKWIIAGFFERINVPIERPF